jgi:5'-nucleotidase
VDVVLSGVNLGPNLGNSMWHSGTLAAAKQAALLSKRGIALSTPVGDDEPEFERMKPWVAAVLETLLPATALRLVNVNLPAETPRGLRWTCQSVRHYDGKVAPGTDPMGRRHYWMTVVPLQPAEPRTDRWAVEHGYIAMTPLRLDLTDHAMLERAEELVSTDHVTFDAAAPCS